MVQGTSYDYNNSSKLSMPSASSWEKTAAKRSGYEAVHRLGKEKQQQQQENAAAAAASKYGAWGATFRNKEHFADMHHF